MGGHQVYKEANGARCRIKRVSQTGLQQTRDMLCWKAYMEAGAVRLSYGRGSDFRLPTHEYVGQPMHRIAGSFKALAESFDVLPAAFFGRTHVSGLGCCVNFFTLREP